MNTVMCGRVHCMQGVEWRLSAQQCPPEVAMHKLCVVNSQEITSTNAAPTAPTALHLVRGRHDGTSYLGML